MVTVVVSNVQWEAEVSFDVLNEVALGALYMEVHAN